MPKGKYKSKRKKMKKGKRKVKNSPGWGPRKAYK